MTVCIGLVFVSSISLKELLLYLAQKVLSRSWAYALIVVFNAFPLIQQEIKSLKEACLCVVKIACLVALDLQQGSDDGL